MRTAVSAPRSQDTAARAWIARLERRGISRKQIAIAAGVSQSTVTRLANGDTADLSRRVASAVLAVRPR